MNTFRLSASFAAIALATAAMAAPLPSATDRAASQTGMNPILARESEPGDDHHQGRGRGRATEEQGATTIARESEPGDDHHQGRGRGRATEEQGVTTIARESEPGDDHHKGRGRAMEEQGATTIAREASEGPRGEGKGHKLSDEPAVGVLA